MTQGVIENILAGIAVALLIFLVSPFWRRLRRHLARSGGALAVDLPMLDDGGPPLSPVRLPEDLSVPEKISYLEEVRATAEADSVAARRRGEDDGEANQRYTNAHECLRSMAFLEHGDRLMDQYRLLSFVGAGRTSVVWKAYDESHDRFVAVKFLRHVYIQDESIVRQFRYSARLMAEFSTLSIAAVRHGVQEVSVGGDRTLVFYVLEYVEGERLDVFAAQHPGKQAQVIDGLLEAGRCIADAHENGVVHRDLKPGNMLVQPNGVLKLVDFDSVLRLGDRRISHHDVGTFGYAAPEVMNGAVDPDVRADIFALARVFAYAFYGKSLPNAYELSVYNLIDLLNCSPAVKDALERASAVDPAKRFTTMNKFLDELQDAIKEDRENALPPLRTVHRERAKIYRILRQSFYGTLAAMMIARPVFAHFGLTHLSDRASVGAFHAIIGSLVWGTFISGAFVLYLILFMRLLDNRVSRYVAAMVCCGIGGLLGGLLVSVPSVFVTHPLTLTCLGWLTDISDPRLTALFETRMMLSYPLTGLLTGLGLGLCLYRGIEIALRRNPLGSGILPVPSKMARRDEYAGAAVLGPWLFTPTSQVFLLFPAIFSFLVTLAIEAASPAEAVGCAMSPNESWRSLGEGIVHYFGALGLMVGFFVGVRAGDTVAK